jgi:starch-binding outer membrane protein SusE/F
MKLIKKLSVFTLAVIIGITGCEKAEPLTNFANGTATVLSSPTLTVAPAPADSNSNSKFVLNWTDPKYSSNPTTFKYVIEIDSANRNFSRAYTRTVIGKLSDSIVAKEFNAIMLAWGFEFNRSYDIDVRVTSSYGNNKEKKTSNILKIKATPYKIPPKVALPTTGKLFIVGDATQGGWNNPVPVPSQELARIDETTFGGIFQFNAGNQYLLLPVNGSWDTKYAIANNSAAGVDLAGDFFFSTGPGDNFKAPSAGGFYKVTVDFQQGKYKVEPYTGQHGLPTNLFIIGGATPGGWNNPVPVPQQQLTRRNAVQWDITLNFTTGQAYLLLPTNGDWGRKFGTDVPAANNLSGTFKAEGGDIPAPAVSGSYKFEIDFFSGKYKLTL